MRKSVPASFLIAIYRAFIHSPRTSTCLDFKVCPEARPRAETMIFHGAFVYLFILVDSSCDHYFATVTLDSFAPAENIVSLLLLKKNNWSEPIYRQLRILR